ncbi:hypothetical protein HHK36_032351 [Tetracentron sinense]|uniref:Uncharacterized protein n=1 Tax=Tetracentron sinense TaxID=13715 RepID=A0A834Y5N3_TETSI|nr:hypothetical protein HHK36_032351 [Tetracentron sinense]
MKKRLKEMEEEAAALREMQAKVEKEMGTVQVLDQHQNSFSGSSGESDLLGFTSLVLATDHLLSLFHMTYEFIGSCSFLRVFRSSLCMIQRYRRIVSSPSSSRLQSRETKVWRLRTIRLHHPLIVLSVV